MGLVDLALVLGEFGLEMRDGLSLFDGGGVEVGVLLFFLNQLLVETVLERGEFVYFEFVAVL